MGEEAEVAYEQWLVEEVDRRWAKDWHYGVPRGLWRNKHEEVVLIWTMTNRHLLHCLRLASTRRVHRSRLDCVAEEAFRRGLVIPVHW